VVPGPDKTFDAVVVRDGERLTIEYSFRNDDDQPVVLFNGMPSVDGPGIRAADPNAVYVRDGGGATVFIVKGWAPSPQPAVEPPFTFRGTVVEPDQTFTESLTVPLPLTARSPYAPPRALDFPARTVSFCLDYAPVDKAVALPGGDAKHPVYAHADSTRQPWNTCSPSVSIE
jgi:hypothetical protein